MDRNVHVKGACQNINVATREGGVDRNIVLRLKILAQVMSPPARVAWIETIMVAIIADYLTGSPPARVAWIETCNDCVVFVKQPVATREGGVDRNTNIFDNT